MRLFGVILTAAAITVAHVPSSAAGLDPKLEDAIRAKAAETLLDPYSAVFTFDIVRDFKGVAGKVCGTVNAKNAYGAYVGRKFFIAAFVVNDGRYLVPIFNTMDMSLDYVLATSKVCD